MFKAKKKINATSLLGLDGIQRDYGLYLRGIQQQIWFIFNTVEADQNPSREQPYQAVIKTDMTVADNTWHTVGVTFDPSMDRIEFYIDGVLRAVEVETKTPNYNSYGPVRVAHFAHFTLALYREEESACTMTSYALSEHLSRTFLDQTKCERSDVLVWKVAKALRCDAQRIHEKKTSCSNCATLKSDGCIYCNDWQFFTIRLNFLYTFLLWGTHQGVCDLLLP